MRRTRLFAPLLAAATLVGCSNKAEDCNWTRTCGDVGTGGATGGQSATTGGRTGAGGARTGGAPGSGGAVATGGLLATGGVIATGGALATGGVVATGGAETGGAPTCSPICAGEKPVCLLSSLNCVQCTGEEHCASILGKTHCDATKNACVECANESQCANTPGKTHCDTTKSACVECFDESQCASTPGKSHCDTTKNACVQCTADAQCGVGAPFCDLTKNLCVQCLDNEDCKSPDASLCFAGRCSPCAANKDCSHIAGKGVCKPPSPGTADADAGADTNVCVECTGTDYTACSKGDSGPGFVCDSLKNACSDELEHSVGLCQPCVSDAQCQTGELCVEQMFNGKSVGHFCLYQQGATGAPADCTTARPYIKAVASTSIDGKAGNVCSLRLSTCTALNQFSQASCASTTGTPDDTLCGVAPGADSKCAAYGMSQFRCTTVCGTDDDCKTGFTCNTGVVPNVCNLL